MKGFVVESMIDKSVLNFKENLAVSASNLSVISGIKIVHSKSFYPARQTPLILFFVFKFFS